MFQPLPAHRKGLGWNAGVHTRNPSSVSPRPVGASMFWDTPPGSGALTPLKHRGISGDHELTGPSLASVPGFPPRSLTRQQDLRNPPFHCRKGLLRLTKTSEMRSAGCGCESHPVSFWGSGSIHPAERVCGLPCEPVGLLQPFRGSSSQRAFRKPFSFSFLERCLHAASSFSIL